jgi:subtilase family serine protease
MSNYLRALLYKRLGVLLIMISVSAWALPLQNRIMQTVDVNQLAPVRGNTHPMARPEFDQGRLEVGETISGSIAFKLSDAQQADLNALLAQQQSPSSPNYHKWLTPEQYASRFGMSADDLAKVTTWLQAQGLTVTRVARGRNEIFFTGTAGQTEYAFHTELHKYLVNGRMRYANATDPQIPAALSNVVLGIRGLNSFRPRSHSSVIRKTRPAPNFTSSVSGNHFVAPADFVTIYNVKGLYDAGFDGASQKIAVVGQTAIQVSDMQAFRTASGLAQNDPQLLLVPGSGTSTTCANDVGEADLDVEWSGAVARSAKIIYVYVGVDAGKKCDTTSQNVFDSLQYAVDNNVAPVISTSYGFCESGLTLSGVNLLRGWAQQANVQGQTITAASGDDGAADCDEGSATAPATTATHGLQVDAPASIPEVTGVGGSEFSGDISSPATYWNASNDAANGSAISYIPETTWNDTTFDIANGGGFSASGGGASTFYSKPSWQTGAGVPSDGKRDVPDVALNASADHDGYLICTQGNCTNGFRDGSGNLSIVGGTSVGAPTFAGILTLINQATNSSGQGNANPILYQLAASTPAAFHDITTGDNKVPCTKGTTDCPNGGSIGFSAKSDYDQVTGLGSVDAFALTTAWQGFSSFTVASNPDTLSVAGGQPTTTALTISSNNAFSGTINLTCSSSSPRATCTVNPTSVALDSTTTSASSTLNVTTTSGSMRNTTSADARRSFSWIAGTAGLGFVSMFLLGVPKKRSGAWMALCLVVFLSAGIGCGGGPSSASSKSTSQSVTLTVTATSGDISRSTTVTLTVQ